ncbi:zona pellucida sperm-binding protein 2-like [Lissotriton helveticus]
MVGERESTRRACACCMGIPMYLISVLLAGCFMFGISKADGLLDFPEHAACWNDAVRITLPQLPRNYSWQELYILNSEGERMDCEHVIDFQTLQVTAHKDCMNYQGSTHYLALQLVISTDVDSIKRSYNITCDDQQGDDPLPSLPQVNCTNDMLIAISRNLPAFDEGSRTVASTWYLEVTDPETQTTYRWTTADASEHGYKLLNDPVNGDLVIRVQFNGTGVEEIQEEGYSLYFADIALLYYLFNQRIQIDVQMICAPGPYACNGTHLTIVIPTFPGPLAAIAIDGMDIPMNQLIQNGITLEIVNGTKLYIEKGFLKKNKCLKQTTFVSSITLTFLYKKTAFPMVIYPECQCTVPATPVAVCNADGFMDVEVLATRTVPKVNLSTVRVRDAACLPYNKSSGKVTFHIPLDGCGTTIRYDGNNIVYENEVRALWVDLQESIIARESEFRMTVRCLYKGNAEVVVRAAVLTKEPPVSLARSDGPISLILNLFPDRSFTQAYSERQYPVVKLLRQPIFLEVQLLNRDDPNIELKLNDCWATSSRDPTSTPRWDLVVDGCDYQNDNSKTVFHPVDRQVQHPNYRKRFEVKTFTFVSGNAALSSLVYFHCTALICNILAPDSPLCSKMCPNSRRRREISDSSKGSLVSLLGPVIFQDSKLERNSEDPVTSILSDKFPAHLNEGALSIVVVVVVVLICFAVVSLVVLKFRPSKKFW